MKPICNDIRRLIIRAKLDGKPVKEIAYIFDVGEDTVFRLWRLFKQTESLDPKGFKGRPSRLTDDMIVAIDNKINDQPDATLSKIIEDLNLPIGKSQLQRFLVKRGYSRKKKLYIQKLNKERMLSKNVTNGKQNKNN